MEENAILMVAFKVYLEGDFPVLAGNKAGMSVTIPYISVLHFLYPIAPELVAVEPTNCCNKKISNPHN